MRCARTLRRRGFSGSILIVGDERHAPYNRPPLSKELLRGEASPELTAAEQPEWYARHAVELRTDVTVTALEPDVRLARLSDGDAVRFERCLLATGAAPRRPPIPGAERTWLLRTLDDSLRLRESAAAGVRVVVIGGGFIGLEAASSMAVRGASVTVLELADAAWGASLGHELSAWAARALDRIGVTLRMGVAVTAIEPEAVLVRSERLPVDFVLAGVGVTPRVELARVAGLKCDDGVVTDRRHATSAPGILAAGDVARVGGRRVEHWHAAREGGERAALAMLDLPLSDARAPWVFSEFADQALDVVGYAPTWERLEVLGDASSDRFAVAYVVDGVVDQLAIVNGCLDVAERRRWIEGRPAANRLHELSVALRASAPP